MLCIRAAQFVPLPGFRNAVFSGAAAGNVVDLLVPKELALANRALSLCALRRR